MEYGKELYEIFLQSKTKDKWQRFGAKRRAGVLAPLFSIYSKNSIGIGEIPDLKLLADWCVKCGMSIIQLLPMNDTGFDFTPYDAQSTFALDPMYLSLENLKDVDTENYRRDIEKLREKFPAGTKRVNYKVKKDKLKLLWKIFENRRELTEGFESFCEKSAAWLNDYVAYKVLKEKFEQSSWEEWEEHFKYREGDSVGDLVRKNEEVAVFYRWLQWQLFEQFVEAKKYANSKGVYIQGDLPFLVSRDSVDVWANQNYFKLNISSGAPPDMYFAKGQRWGMPAYSWEHIEEHNYDYLIQRLKYAENFYDMFRIDHFVGLFRLWTIPLSEPIDTYGLNGVFDPENEDEWKEHGQKILDVMVDNSAMLPCAEDLGVVPACSYETLDEYGLPGMDVQRWHRDWGNTYKFKKADKYRVNSSAIISSHDMSPLNLWWQEECGTVDALLVQKICKENDFNYNDVYSHVFDPKTSNNMRLRFKEEFEEAEDVMKAMGKSRTDAWMFYDLFLEAANEKEMFLEHIGCSEACAADSKDFTKQALQAVNNTKSVFSVQLLQDYLSLGDYFDDWDLKNTRANVPGSVDDKNWSIVMPVSLEDLLEAGINATIKKIHVESGRG